MPLERVDPISRPRSSDMVSRWISVPACLLLCGCVLGLAAETASVGGTGKTIGDHVLDAATGKDCRLVEGVARSDRRACEDPGSPVTKRDFKGVGGAGGKENE